MTIEGNKITANEGKVVRIKRTEEIIGKSFYLSECDYLDSEYHRCQYLLDDFEEIDIPDDWSDEKSKLTDTEALKILMANE